MGVWISRGYFISLLYKACAVSLYTILIREVDGRFVTLFFNMSQNDLKRPNRILLIFSAIHIKSLAFRFATPNYGYDLSPETNLFSSAKEQLVKEEAITLLRTFIKEIHAYRYDSIRLYDSFELRFRIVENGNDTGFIEKIANVGSEGTDILVKAMINIMLLNVFKEGASRKFKDFKLHCMMDEIGKLHPNNISGILKFANDRNIILINGSPTELNRDAYKHVYLLTKGTQNKTRIARLISDKQL